MYTIWDLVTGLIFLLVCAAGVAWIGYASEAEHKREVAACERRICLTSHTKAVRLDGTCLCLEIPK